MPIPNRPSPFPDPREFFRADIRHDTPEHVVLWQEWFTAHGIDPSEVLLTEWVERRDFVDPSQEITQYQIVWLELGTRDGVEIHVQREVHLPQPPLPFPVP